MDFSIMWIFCNHSKMNVVERKTQKRKKTMRWKSLEKEKEEERRKKSLRLIGCEMQFVELQGHFNRVYTFRIFFSVAVERGKVHFVHLWVLHFLHLLFSVFFIFFVLFVALCVMYDRKLMREKK